MFESLNYQILSLHTYFRGVQSSMTRWWVFLTMNLTWNTFGSWCCPKLLKMVNPCNGQHPRHDNLFPKNLSNLLQASQKPLDRRSPSNHNEIERDLHLSILEAFWKFFMCSVGDTNEGMKWLHGGFSFLGGFTGENRKTTCDNKLGPIFSL